MRIYCTITNSTSLLFTIKRDSIYLQHRLQPFKLLLKETILHPQISSPSFFKRRFIINRSVENNTNRFQPFLTRQSIHCSINIHLDACSNEDFKFLQRLPKTVITVPSYTKQLLVHQTEATGPTHLNETLCWLLQRAMMCFLTAAVEMVVIPAKAQFKTQNTEEKSNN